MSCIIDGDDNCTKEIVLALEWMCLSNIYEIIGMNTRRTPVMANECLRTVIANGCIGRRADHRLAGPIVDYKSMVQARGGPIGRFGPFMNKCFPNSPIQIETISAFRQYVRRDYLLIAIGSVPTGVSKGGILL